MSLLYFVCTMFIKPKSFKLPTETNIDCVPQGPSVNFSTPSELRIIAPYVKCLYVPTSLPGMT